MPWAKLDDKFYDHPKTVEIGTLGAGLFTMALSYVANKLTDGFIATAMIKRLAADIDDPIALADKLVEVGYFEKAQGGYWIHDYLEYNPSAETILRERAEAKQRMAEARQKQTRGDDGQYQAIEDAPEAPDPDKDDEVLADCSGEVQANKERTLPEVAPSPVPVPVPVPVPIPDPVPVFPDARSAPAALNISPVWDKPDFTHERRSFKLPKLPSRVIENDNLTEAMIEKNVDHSAGVWSTISKDYPSVDIRNTIRSWGKIWGYKHVDHAFSHALFKSGLKTMAEIYNTLGDTFDVEIEKEPATRDLQPAVQGPP